MFSLCVVALKGLADIKLRIKSFFPAEQAISLKECMKGRRKSRGAHYKLQIDFFRSWYSP